ncbi:MAG: hypothetical protein AAGJ28_08810 [Pseudomonadota bacterium]
MSDVFLSYKCSDEDGEDEYLIAKELASMLQEMNIETWFAEKNRENYRRLVSDQNSRIKVADMCIDKVNDAKLVIVLWSIRSVKSNFVYDEAIIADKNDKLIQISIDKSGKIDRRAPFIHSNVIEINCEYFNSSAPDVKKLIAVIEERLDRPGLSALHSIISGQVTDWQSWAEWYNNYRQDPSASALLSKIASVREDQFYSRIKQAFAESEVIIDDFRAQFGKQIKTISAAFAATYDNLAADASAPLPDPMSAFEHLGLNKSENLIEQVRKPLRYYNDNTLDETQNLLKRALADHESAMTNLEKLERNYQIEKTKVFNLKKENVRLNSKFIWVRRLLDGTVGVLVVVVIILIFAVLAMPSTSTL